jgi:hypothetical protein
MITLLSILITCWSILGAQRFFYVILNGQSGGALKYGIIALLHGPIAFLMYLHIVYEKYCKR